MINHRSINLRTSANPRLSETCLPIDVACDGRAKELARPARPRGGKNAASPGREREDAIPPRSPAPVHGRERLSGRFFKKRVGNPTDKEPSRCFLTGVDAVSCSQRLAGSPFRHPACSGPAIILSGGAPVPGLGGLVRGKGTGAVPQQHDECRSTGNPTREIVKGSRVSGCYLSDTREHRHVARSVNRFNGRR